MKKMMCALSLVFAITVCSINGASAQTTVEHKTGWSNKKKGAVIGAGAGAVTGAVVSKKHGKGAVIGGAIGAAGGYLYGRHRDKKHPTRTEKTIVKTK